MARIKKSPERIWLVNDPNAVTPWASIKGEIWKGDPICFGEYIRSDIVERQLAERNAELTAMVKVADGDEKEINSLKDELVRKNAALQPFAEFADDMDADGRDLRDEEGIYAFKAGDFRNARNALSGSNDKSKEIICDVLTMKHSSGFPDYFTRIKCGDRQITTYMSKIKGRCEYHAAEFDWLLNGSPKPDILAFDDTEPEGLSEYLASISKEVSFEWQLIDSVPRDGKLVLLANRFSDSDQWPLIGYATAFPSTIYHSDGKKFPEVGKLGSPTHWMYRPSFKG